jgi:hypothetical protein
VHTPVGVPVTVIVTTPVDGTVMATLWVPPITKFGSDEGLNTGELSKSADGGAIVIEVDALESGLSPTRLVAETLTV